MHMAPVQDWGRKLTNVRLRPSKCSVMVGGATCNKPVEEQEELTYTPDILHVELSRTDVVSCNACSTYRNKAVSLGHRVPIAIAKILSQETLEHRCMTFGPHTRLTPVTNACASPHSGLVQAACESCYLQCLMTGPAFILSRITALGGHCWSVLTGRPLQAQLDASCVHGVNDSRLSTLLFWQLARACYLQCYAL